MAEWLYRIAGKSNVTGKTWYGTGKLSLKEAQMTVDQLNKDPENKALGLVYWVEWAESPEPVAGQLYKVYWESLKTGKTGQGYGEFTKVVAQAWADEMNEKYKADGIIHWIGPVKKIEIKLVVK